MQDESFRQMSSACQWSLCSNRRLFVACRARPISSLEKPEKDAPPSARSIYIDKGE